MMYFVVVNVASMCRPPELSGSEGYVHMVRTKLSYKYCLVARILLGMYCKPPGTLAETQQFLSFRAPGEFNFSNQFTGYLNM